MADLGTRTLRLISLHEKIHEVGPKQSASLFCLHSLDVFFECLNALTALITLMCSFYYYYASTNVARVLVIGQGHWSLRVVFSRVFTFV